MSTIRSNLRSLVSPDGALILDLEQDCMIRLNQTGGQVWLALQRGEPLEEIAKTIATDTGEDLARVHREVQDFCVLLQSLLEGTR